MKLFQYTLCMQLEVDSRMTKGDIRMDGDGCDLELEYTRTSLVFTVIYIRISPHTIATYLQTGFHTEGGGEVYWDFPLQLESPPPPIKKILYATLADDHLCKYCSTYFKTLSWFAVTMDMLVQTSTHHV